MLSKKKEAELDLMTNLSMYLMEEESNLENVLAVIADVAEAKQIVLSWQKMTNEEAQDVEFSGFASKMITEVEDGAKVLNLSRQGTEWSISCKLSFAIIASFVTMIRNDVMENYTEERVEAYKDFIEAIKKASNSGTEAITSLK